MAADMAGASSRFGDRTAGYFADSSFRNRDQSSTHDSQVYNPFNAEYHDFLHYQGVDLSALSCELCENYIGVVKDVDVSTDSEPVAIQDDVQQFLEASSRIPYEQWNSLSGLPQEKTADEIIFGSTSHHADREYTKISGA